jgi:sugar lactone lactonase YvrE
MNDGPGAAGRLRTRLTTREAPLFALALLLGALALALPAPAAQPSDRGIEGTLLVADLRGQALVELDLTSGAERRIDLPGGPHELLALPDGRVVASLEQTGALAVVERASGHVAVIETGGLPHGLAYRDGTLHVTDRAIDATRRFTLRDWNELPPLAGGRTPHAVAAGPDFVAVAAAGDDALLVGDQAWPVSPLPETVAVSADGDRMAVAGALGGGLHIFAANGAPVTELALGGRPVRVIFAPDGRTVAVALSAEGRVAVIAPSGGERSFEVGGVPDGLAFDGSGRWLFVSDIAGGLVSAIDLERKTVAWRQRVGESAGALLLLP